MCVTCLSEEQDASLPSTKRVVLRTNYSIKGSQHKHSKQPQTSNLSKQGYLFDHLVLLRCCDLEGMAQLVHWSTWRITHTMVRVITTPH
jgi:hypothetical protein